ncbi:MAG: hypothetical protein EBT39_03090, partial [Sphingobacteriia bacterium]|nr:hypothetical protein [Candidatus Fonsibacter lacus]
IKIKNNRFLPNNSSDIKSEKEKTAAPDITKRIIINPSQIEIEFNPNFIIFYKSNSALNY